MRGLILFLAIAASQGVLGASKSGDGASSHPLMTPGYALEYLLGVLLVMAALGVFALLARRLQGRVGGAHEGLRVRASLPLGGKERLVIVQVQDETLLLGVSSGCVQLVSKLATPNAPEASSSASNSWLSRTLNRSSRSNTSGGAFQ